MANNDESRVLGRRGARDVTTEELDQVTGAAAARTLVCTAVMGTGTVTGPGDGDGCSDSDSDPHFY